MNSTDAIDRGQEFELFRNGRALYPRMLEDIRNARQAVLLEMYIFRGDATGEAFAKALAEAAARGVFVRVLYDALGCHDVPKSFFDGLAASGVSVREFNPIRAFGKKLRYRRLPLFRRDHRKLLIADFSACYIGGINIGDEFLDWEDLTVRLTGPVVRDAVRSFNIAWDARFLRAVRSLFHPKPKPAAPIAICESAPLEDFSSVKRIYLAGLKRARADVVIAAAYFVPSRKMRKLLSRLVRKGVRVRVIVPAHSDVNSVWYAGRRFFTYFLKHGVRLYFYEPSVLHAKYAAADDHWATIGSANLNPTSFYLTLELNVLIRDRAVIAAVRENFERTVGDCREIKLDEWCRRPWYEKALEYFFYHAFRWFIPHRG